MESKTLPDNLWKKACPKNDFRVHSWMMFHQFLNVSQEDFCTHPHNSAKPSCKTADSNFYRKTHGSASEMASSQHRHRHTNQGKMHPKPCQNALGSTCQKMADPCLHFPPFSELKTLPKSVKNGSQKPSRNRGPESSSQNRPKPIWGPKNPEFGPQNGPKS